MTKKNDALLLMLGLPLKWGVPNVLAINPFRIFAYIDISIVSIKSFL
jgi:hypothetical protein